jgi:hypothetical protein
MSRAFYQLSNIATKTSILTFTNYFKRIAINDPTKGPSNGAKLRPI